MEQKLATIPVNVNVVPGDQAAGRVRDPEVETELAFQRAQREKKEAAEAMRRGNLSGARQRFDSARAELSAARVRAPRGMRDDLDQEIEMLSRLSAESERDWVCCPQALPGRLPPQGAAEGTAMSKASRRRRTVEQHLAEPLRVGEPVGIGNLAVFPLFGPEPRARLHLLRPGPGARRADRRARGRRLGQRPHRREPDRRRRLPASRARRCSAPSRTAPSTSRCWSAPGAS